VPSAKKSSPKSKRLGRNLARLRTRAGLTQESLAEQADISTRYLQDLEAGLYSPTIWKIDALRKVLKCDWDEVMSGL